MFWCKRNSWRSGGWEYENSQVYYIKVETNEFGVIAYLYGGVFSVSYTNISFAAGLILDITHLC